MPHQSDEEKRRKGPIAHILILGLAALVLFAVHGIALRYVSTHAALPAAVMAGLIVVVIAKHLGLMGALSAKLWGNSRSGRKKPG